MYAVYPYYRVWLTRLPHTACIYRVHLVQTIVIASRDGVHFSPISTACISCCFWRPPSSPERVCDKMLSHCTKIEKKGHVTKTTPLPGVHFHAWLVLADVYQRTKSKASRGHSRSLEILYSYPL